MSAENHTGETLTRLSIETLQELLKVRFDDSPNPAVGNCSLFIGTHSVSLTDERGGVISENLGEIVEQLEGPGDDE